MDTTHATFRIDAAQLKAVHALAKEQDVSLGAVMRDALDAHLRRHATPPKTTRRADEALVAPIRSLLAVDLATARSWSELLRRCHAKGFALEPLGGGLILRRVSDAQRICKASEIGPTYRQYCERFGGPFPGRRLAQGACHLDET